jgi:Icc protein
VAVRALQITDLHILPDAGAMLYGTDTSRSLRAVLDAAMALPAPPTVVLATGDLAEDGSEASYRRLRSILVETGLPTHVVPGNHDSVDAMRSSLLGDAIQMTPVVEVGAWRVVLLDSRVPGKSHGFLERAELERLSAALADGAGRPVLIGVHHGPVSPCPSTGCQLQNAGALLGLLAAHPAARAVISGHAHVELSTRFEHVDLLMTPSTCSQAWHAPPGAPVDHEDFWASHRLEAGRHGFRMLSLGPGGELETEVHWVR